MVEDEGGEKSAGDAEASGPRGHTIEIAKSGRARCRSCNEGIKKGELRLGEETPNMFSESGGMSYRWHHLRCAADKKPRELKAALARYTAELPERATLEASIHAWEERQRARKKATEFPYADRATTARSKCMQCHEPIEKGDARIAIERPAESYMGGTSPGYLHPRCAQAHTKSDTLVAALAANSVALSADELEAALAEVQAGTSAG